MNNEETIMIITYYRNNPEREIIFLKHFPEAQVCIDFHTKEEACCFRWNFNTRCTVETKVKKITYISDDQIKDYYEIDIKHIEKNKVLKHKRIGLK